MRTISENEIENPRDQHCCELDLRQFSLKRGLIMSLIGSLTHLKTKCPKSVLFIVENKVTSDHALFSIDRISKHNASLGCNFYRCGYRLVLEHSIQTRDER